MNLFICMVSVYLPSISGLPFVVPNGNYQCFKEGGCRVAANGHRTAFDGREAAFSGRSADRQRRRKEKHLIEAAPFQLWPPRSNARDYPTAVQGGFWGGFAPLR